MNYPIKKCAFINDFSGYGRCSIAVSLPVLSAMQVQCCALPTAILSNHTGYPNYFFDSYTDKMQSYINEWKKLGLSFDTIFSGFLGCSEQIEIVKKFFEDFKAEGTCIIVDPVMGDNGKIYSTYNSEMCSKMRSLVSLADIITPNITEACLLLERDYCGEEISYDSAKEIVTALSENKRSVVLTGIIEGDYICTLVYDKSLGEYHYLKNSRVKSSYPGTGDLFASVLCAAFTNGASLFASAKAAANFVEETTAFTAKYDTDHNDGIIFEPSLNKLCSFRKEIDNEKK